MSGGKVNRRDFMKYVVTAIVCGAVTGVGGFFAGSAVLPSKTVTILGPTETVVETTTTTVTVTQTIGVMSTPSATPTTTPPEISIESEKPVITLISVYDNYQVDTELKTAWGFATVIKTSRDLILFDTGGSSEILLFNIGKLGINPASIKKIVISHIHGDHIGGLEGFLEKNGNVTVFIPSSFPNSIKNMIIQKGAKFVEISTPRKISDFVYTTGELYGPPEEQSLIIDSRKGLVVITGCAHPGIVNIVKKAKELTKKDKVYLVLGGFHHPPISCVKEFRKLGVEKVAPSHCTGDLVREAFRKEYKEDFIEYGVGRIIEIR